MAMLMMMVAMRNMKADSNGCVLDSHVPSPVWLLPYSGGQSETPDLQFLLSYWSPWLPWESRNVKQKTNSKVCS